MKGDIIREKIWDDEGWEIGWGTAEPTRIKFGYNRHTAENEKKGWDETDGGKAIEK